VEMFIEQSWYLIALFSCIALVAAYVDAIAGGGGTIQVSTLLLSGLPPVSVLATNKIVSMVGTMMAISKYAASGKIRWKLVIICLPPCLFAAYLGGLLAIYLSNDWLQLIIMISVVVALIITLWPQHKPVEVGQPYSTDKAIYVLTPIAFYDGLVGPGAGTYLAIFKHRFLNFSFINATATAKPLNLATNMAASVAFVNAGKVFWPFAIPMICASALGGWLGSHYAVKHGSKFVKKVIVWVVVGTLLLNLVKLSLS